MKEQFASFGVASTEIEIEIETESEASMKNEADSRESLSRTGDDDDVDDDDVAGDDESGLVSAVRGVIDEIGFEGMQTALRLIESDSSARSVDVDPTSEDPVKSSFRFSAGQEIGPYRILRVLGEGGMGVVYLADQIEPIQRKVALKLLLPGQWTERRILRFERERQLLALVDHPNIANVYGAGSTSEGQPYLAMEYAPGGTLSEYCSRYRPTLKKRLRIFCQICRAVYAAHQKRILHRDLKPSNVLVVVHDGKAVPKVIDFGLAKFVGREPVGRIVTDDHRFGTVTHMSPEQLGFSRYQDIDTRSDVYSLGVILYELLTGCLPFEESAFEGKTLKELQGIIANQQPCRPSARVLDSNNPVRFGRSSAYSRRLRGDLDRITLAALAKDREDRYGTVAELIADVERYLRYDPIEKRPPSLVYRGWKFVLRNRVKVSAVLVVGLSLMIGLLGTGLGWIRAERQRKETLLALKRADAERHSQEAMRNYLSQILRAVDPGILGRDVRFLDALEWGERNLSACLSDEPAVESLVRSLFGEIYYRFAEFDEAEDHLEAALAVAPRDAGRPEAAIALGNRALVHLSRGRSNEAWSDMTKALGMARQSLEPNSRDYLTLRNNHGILLLESDKLEEAESVFSETLALRTKVLGQRDFDTLNAMSNLAVCQKRLGKTDEAGILYEEVVEIESEVFGEGHLYTAYALHNYAVFLAEEGDLERAEELFDRSLNVQKSKLGERHPLVAKTLREVGALFCRQREFEKARVKLIESIEKFEVIGSSRLHFYVLLAKNDLAVCNLKLGESRVAERLLREVIRRCPGDKPRLGASARENLAKIREEEGNVEDAKDLLSSAISMLEESMGPRDSKAQSLRSKLDKLDEPQESLHADP